MPHITIEYSANLDPKLNIEALVKALHEAAIGTGVFPLGGTRTRAIRHQVYAIADQAPENGFVHVSARIGHGRDAATKQRAGDLIFAALSAHTEKLFETSPLALSLEIVETETWKKNNIHKILEAKS
jgi:5-carboxymethyl-2-hydroxymuconate isomerase